MNPWCAPERVLLRHPSNQAAHIGGDGRSPAASPTFPRPEQPEALPMPPDDGLRFHDHECRSPAAPGTRQPGPEPPVGSRNLQPSPSGSLEHLQLMAEREDLEVERGTRAHDSTEHRQNGHQYGRHRVQRLAVSVANSTAPTRTRFSGATPARAPLALPSPSRLPTFSVWADPARPAASA